MIFKVCELSHTHSEKWMRNKWVILDWEPPCQTATIAPLSPSLSPCNTHIHTRKGDQANIFVSHYPSWRGTSSCLSVQRFKITTDESSPQLLMREKLLLLRMEICCQFFTAVTQKVKYPYTSFSKAHPSFQPSFSPYLSFLFLLHLNLPTLLLRSVIL